MFPVLDPKSEQFEAMTSASEFGSLRISDLPRVSMPAGGGKAWSWTDAEGGDHTEKVITGLLVAVSKRGALWPSVEPTQGGRPLIVTSDLKVGRILGDDYGDLDPDEIDRCRIDGTDDLVHWDQLSYTKFGSHGRGKRANEGRVLFVLQAGEVIPVAIQASAGSIAGIDAFLRKASLSRRYYQCIVEVGLERSENAGGQPFSRVTIKTVGVVTKAEGEVIKRLYTDPLTGATPAEAGDAYEGTAAPF